MPRTRCGERQELAVGPLRKPLTLPERMSRTCSKADVDEVDRILGRRRLLPDAKGSKFAQRTSYGVPGLGIAEAARLFTDVGLTVDLRSLKSDARQSKNRCKYLIRLVGVRGFEPPAPASRIQVVDA